MNRVIKFRGMSVDGGEWVYGGFYRHEDDYVIVSSQSVLVGSDTNYHENIEVLVSVKPETVGQFIIKVDGEDVFEGDKLMLSDDDGEWESVVGEYGEVDTQGFSTDYDYTLLKWFLQHSFTGARIIGNIYQQEPTK